MQMNLDRDPFNLIITGVGGQGNVLMAQFFGKALTDEGFTVTVGDIYGAAQRGGPVSSHIRISNKNIYSPLTPSGKAHLIVSLEPVEALRVLGTYGNPDVVVISNSRPNYPFEVFSGGSTYPDLGTIQEAASKLSQKAIFIDASAIAIDLGAAVLTNTVMSGVTVGIGILPLLPEPFMKVLQTQFSKEKYKLNATAFEKGFEVGALVHIG